MSVQSINNQHTNNIIHKQILEIHFYQYIIMVFVSCLNDHFKDARSVSLYPYNRS